MRAEITIVNRGYYRIYQRDGRFYIDTHGDIIHSFATLQGVREHLYYMGYLQSKDSEI